MLIETVVDVINTKDVFRAEADKGILIRCCYSPVGLAGEVRIPGSSENMVSLFGSVSSIFLELLPVIKLNNMIPCLQFPTLLLELIVTPDYPNASPVVSEALPLDFG